ncbi:MAG: hypothetical protein R3321_11850 [Nitrososphaeraceae archaeon]|nr:hypothetical protein [Nitrososphaeraceae archaeon]
MNTLSFKNRLDHIFEMAIPSKENAKIRIEEFRTILKYMPFLQKNGLSDCGRGQIIGQMHLLQEFLNEKQTTDEIINTQQSSSSVNNNRSDTNIFAKDDVSITDTVSLPQFYEPVKTEITASSKDSNLKDNTFDIDHLILEDDNSNQNEENKLLGSRWLRPFKNDETEKKKPLDYFDKNEITQSWKEKIRKMTQSDII